MVFDRLNSLKVIDDETTSKFKQHVKNLLQEE
jgi:hypothetical protein